MTTIFLLCYLIFTLIVLYAALNSLVWEIGSAIYLFVATVLGLPVIPGILLWLIIGSIIAIIHFESIRFATSDFIFSKATKFIPKLSKTEEEALNAGDTWLEQDIFRGSPNFDAVASTVLSEEEQNFLNNEVETLCSMLNEWEISQNQDLPKSVWDFMKENGFFGLVISKDYGGKGFSARAHSDIVVKIASRSGVAAVTVMVPNSLGPGELLQHYGTKEQKEHYLPKLAKGIEIPCFALTEPEAGSDATSIKSEAIVMYKEINGKNVLGLMLTLNKRYITLSPVATLIGLAVKLKDPEGLLQGIGKEGITCILIPRETENLEIGNRHLPAHQPFMNGTIRGENIFVPISTIIGGQEKAGNGWQMLVECLSIGRSISLPALGTASSSIAYLTAGAFARIRRQFNVEIARFEGVEEKLAEIAGLNYIINATRFLTVAAVNQHKEPSVASAITKYFNTELSRITVNNAMDIHGGRGVVVGYRNYLTNHYQSIPISITVEGANIMTRNLLIFGQGAMACHPFLKDEFYAISKKDKESFRLLIWKHIFYFLQNFAKTICSAWTGGIFIKTSKRSLKRAYQKLQRLSYAYAWIADLALIYLGGELKRKERLSARLADGMSYLYLAMAVLRFYQDNKEGPEHQLHAKWALNYCFFHAQKSLVAFCDNVPSRVLGFFIRICAFPIRQSMRYPSDKLDHQLTQVMTQNNDYRQFLTKMIYLSHNPEEPVDKMEHALQLILKHESLYKKIGGIKRHSFDTLKEQLAENVTIGALSQREMDDILKLELVRFDAMQVDEFTCESMEKKTFASVL